MSQSSEEELAAIRIAFIQARWHAGIVDECRKAFIGEMGRLCSPKGLIDVAAKIDVFDVPGAFEIPLLARSLAKSGRYSAIVASALVVDGGIYRHEFIAETVIAGLMQAQMDTDVPVLSAVLTPHIFHDSEEHRQFFLDHFKIKGREAAEACVAVLALRRQLETAA